MNELMWEIAEKAMDQGPNYHHYDPVFLAEYTKLIVQECASVAYKTAWDDLTLDYGTGVIPLHIHNTIKEHFGVEE